MNKNYILLWKDYNGDVVGTYQSVGKYDSF